MDIVEEVEAKPEIVAKLIRQTVLRSEVAENTDDRCHHRAGVKVNHDNVDYEGSTGGRADFLVDHTDGQEGGVGQCAERTGDQCTDEPNERLS